MADLAFKKKITKKAFEAKLIKDFGHDKLSASPYSENGWDNENDCPTVTKLTLYYIKDVHIATWCKGEGWIFEKAYNGDMEKEQYDINVLFGEDDHAYHS